MSPSESQLRAALQDGEGDAPDAGLLISHAVRVRYDRRRRITSIAGGVAVVAVVGVGLTALVSSGSGDEKGGSSSTNGYADSAAGRAAGQTANVPAAKAPSLQRSSAAASSAGPTNARAPGAAGTVDALKCPATPARLMLPGGGGSGQFGSSDPLFASPVSAMKVCGYPQRLSTSGSTLPQSHVYDQANSARIVTALESAPDAASYESCAIAHPPSGTVEILAVDAKGNALKPVVLTLNCRDSKATNGTAVRYLGAVPDELLRLVH